MKQIEVVLVVGLLCLHSILAQNALDLTRGYVTFPQNSVVGVPTSSFGAGLTNYPPANVVFTPLSAPGSAIIFDPPTLTFSSTPTNIYFNYIITTTGPATIYWQVGGENGANYTVPINQTVTGGMRSITCSPFAANIPIGSLSNTIRCSTDYPPPEPIYVTPVATGLTFNPTSISFSADVPIAQLSFAAVEGTGPTPITFTPGGGAYGSWYNYPATQTVSVTLRTFDLSYTTPIPQVVPGKMSPVYTITTNWAPLSEVTIFLNASNGGITFFPTTLTFSPTVTSQTFQFIASTSGTFSYVLGGPNATLYVAPPTTTITVTKLTLTDPAIAATQTCGDAYNYALALSSPPPNYVTVEVFASGATIAPSVFNFTPATSSIPFTLTGNYVTASIIRYVVTGQDSALVNTVANDQFTVAQKTITVPTFVNLLPGVTSPFVMSVSAPPASDLTITPNAPGITFNPPAFLFDSDSLLSVSFTATPTNPGMVLLSYTITGTDAGCFNVPTSVNLNVGQLPVTMSPTTIVAVPAGVQSAPYTLTVNNLLSPVDIIPWGYGLTFTPPVVSLTQALPSAYFTFVGSTVGTQVINFNLSNTGSTMVAPIAANAAVINQRTFTVPTFPGVYVQVPSDPLTIGLTYAPPTGVILRLWAPDTTFTPETLTFSPTVATQSFTFVTTSTSTKTVTFFVEGTDAALYSTPTSPTFTPQLRPLSRSTPDTPTFNSPFIFTISTPFLPPNGLTFTPVGAFTFTPPTASILPAGPGAVSFTAVPNDIGNTPLHIIATGDVSLYQTVADIAVTTATATFTLDLPSATTVVPLVYGVASAPFYLYATVPPVNDVTLTITSPMVAVSPSTLTFTAGSTVASFTVTADATVFGSSTGGQVVLTYTVGGTDAANFAMGTSTFTAAIQSPYRRLSVNNAAGSITVQPGQLSYFSISAVDIPINSVTVTPLVNANAFVTITPAYAVFTPTVTTATFSITTSVPTPQATLEVTVSGPDAYLYKDSAATIGPVVTFTQGVITTNMPTTVNVAQPTVVEFMDISALVPQAALTVTPYVISGPAITFTPASLVFSPTALSLRYTILASAPGAAQIGFTVTGTNAALFTVNTATTITVSPLNFQGLAEFSGDTLVVGVPSSSYTAYVPYLPPTGVTLTPVSAELTFTPPAFAFSPTVGAVVFTVTPTVVSRQSVIAVAWTVSGTDANLFSIPFTVNVAVVPRTLTLITSDTLYGGVASQLSLVAQYPPPTGFSVTATANGVIINPAVLNFTPNQSSVAFTVTPIASGINVVSLTTALTGTDANWYSSPALPATPVAWGTINVPADVGSGYTVTGTIQLTPAPPSTLVVTPVAQGVTFIPSALVFSPSVSSLSFSAVSSVSGAAQFTYTLSGPSAGFYRMTTATQSTTALFETLDLLVTSPSSTSYTYVAGSVSRPFVVSSQTSAGVLVAPTQPIYIVPTANFADAVFNPSNVSIVAPANTATFTVTSNTPGNLVVGFNVYGPGATSFSTNFSTQLAVAQRSFDIDPTLFVNSDYTPTSSVFFYNVTSGPYTIYARSVPSNVTLTLISENFVFNPSTLYFSSTTTSANFTITGNQIGAAVISFLVGGSDADTFAVPAPHTYTRVTYQIQLPVVPALSVGVKSDPQTVYLIPAPSEAFILYLPSPSSRIVYNPTQLSFPAGQNSSTFTVTAYATTFTEAQPSIPGMVQPITTSPNPITLAGRENGEFETYNIPLATPTSVNVVPGIFILHHPRYQMNVKSHVDVALSVAPRSDVVVTLYGNNMLFEPPHVTFTANGPLKQEVKVTPLHATSYEIDYQGFKVNYVCSGTNVNDYLCPSETLHYIALPRGYIAAAVTLPAAFVIFLIIVGIIIYRRRNNGEEKQRRLSVSVGGNYQSFSQSPSFPAPQVPPPDEESRLIAQ